MKQITLILALVLTIACSNSGEGKTNQKIDLKETQKWLKGLGKNYTINQLKNLKKLDLNSTKVIDISSLKSLKNLKGLWLDRTQVSNITALKGLKNLKLLSLISTQASDFSPLKGLKNLKELRGRKKITSVFKLKLH